MAEGFSIVGGAGASRQEFQTYGFIGAGAYKILREDRWLLRVGGIFSLQGEYSTGYQTIDETHDPREVLNLARRRGFRGNPSSDSVFEAYDSETFNGYQKAYLAGPTFSLFYHPHFLLRRLGIGLNTTIEAGYFHWKKSSDLFVSYFRSASRDCCDSFSDSKRPDGWTFGIVPHIDAAVHIDITPAIGLELSVDLLSGGVTGQSRYFSMGPEFFLPFLWLVYTWGGERFYEQQARLENSALEREEQSRKIKREWDEKSEQLEYEISSLKTKGEEALGENSLDQAFFFYNSAIQKAEVWLELVKGTEKEYVTKKVLFDLRFKMSETQFKRDFYDIEMENLQSFMENHPDYVNGYYSLGALTCMNGKYTESIRFLQEFLRKVSRVEWESKNIANAYYFLGFAFYYRASQTKTKAEMTPEMTLDLRQSLQQFNKALAMELPSEDLKIIQEKIKDIQMRLSKNRP